MPKLTRRNAIFTGVAAVGVSSTACVRSAPIIPVKFLHGIASGDPTANAVILWTRLTPDEGNFQGNVDGKWEISDSKTFAKIVQNGVFQTSPRKDYTVKIDAIDLQSGQNYYYRFHVGDTFSPIGKTKTLPTGRLENARLAVVSCSNYPFGFFNVYDHIARQGHFDAVVHLGDYFYEYGRDGYGGQVGVKIGREHEPAHEVLSLDDYRTRHAQYKSDVSAQSMLASCALICIWDDHETANDSWKTGAQNHNEGEGSWDERRANAMQAYYEWMPVRDPAVGQAREALFRNYEFGDLFSLTAIETRLTARTQPIDYADHVSSLRTREGIQNFFVKTLNDPRREMMGETQKTFVGNALKQSKDKNISWRLIANQVLMARTTTPNLTAYKDEDFVKELEKIFPQIHEYIALSPIGLPLNPDAWDGYPQARERFYAMVQEQGVQDILVLTGDTHDAWANTLHTTSGTSMGVELGTSGVTSPGTGVYFGSASQDFSKRLNEKNPEIIYHNNEHHGYIDLTLSHTEGRVDFVNVSTVYAPTYKAFTSKSFKLEKQGGTIALKDV